MLNGKRVIAVIPARGGSKSVPGKNIRLLGGKPLLVWSIEVAQQVSEIDRVIVSTDDAEIASVSRAHGAEVYARPLHLATDEALVIDALKDLLRTLQAEGEAPEWVILLEPTCPLRTSDDVRACLKLVTQGGLRFGCHFQGCRIESTSGLAARQGRPRGVHCRCRSMATAPEAAEGLPVERRSLRVPSKFT